MADKKVQRLRFSYEDDLMLLREFINVNPISNPEGWEHIQRNISLVSKKDFQIRTIKNHLALLIELFLKKIKVEQIQSGVEEPYSEKDRLLEEVSSLCRDSNYNLKTPRKKSVSKEQQLTELGKKVRNEFAAKFSAPQLTDIYDADVIITSEHDYGVSENTIIDDNLMEHLEIVDVQDKPINSQINLSILPTNPLCQQGVSDLNASQDAKGPEEVLGNESVSRPQPSSSHSMSANPRPSISQMNKNARNVLVPARKRRLREPIRKNALEFLSDKADKENLLKKKALELDERRILLEENKLKLEERKVALQENKFNLEYQERMEKLNLERERIQIELKDKTITLQLVKTQQDLMERMLRKCNCHFKD